MTELTDHPFIEMLKSLDDGAAVEEYYDSLKEIVEAVKKFPDDTGKLVITFNVSMLEDGSILITDKFKHSKPRKTALASFIVGPEGSLKPRQLSFDELKNN